MSIVMRSDIIFGEWAANASEVHGCHFFVNDQLYIVFTSFQAHSCSPGRVDWMEASIDEEKYLHVDI